VPYSFTLASEAQASLQALLDRAMGGHAKLAIAAPVAYGEEDEVRVPGGEIVVAVFNATSTPEPEAHGRFLARLALSGRPVVVMVDEAALVGRARGDATRMESRRALWREMASQSGHAIAFVDLANPDVEAIETTFADLS